ncbi:Uu.00g074370.m01.CDS01 [Anthostomella pinea]|uniref:Uu.00g074370.m01.CDS01 n=1 Tax=Anthostomella pinea TaxID=933095 RepID=A0AAI8VVF9_9PEZI|nr:Uu.00g074370.m01.CDS01 [Anthostomella pinea]
MADLKVIHAYRHLYRGLLHAVQFSKPSRYIAQAQLRTAFREEGATFDTRSIARTVRFLEAATRTSGLEHSVLKNLLMTAYFRHYHGNRTWKHVQLNVKQMKNKKDQEHVRRTAYKHYDMTVAMLNKSMGLCLR